LLCPVPGGNVAAVIRYSIRFAYDLHDRFVGHQAVESKRHLVHKNRCLVLRALERQLLPRKRKFNQYASADFFDYDDPRRLQESVGLGTGTPGTRRGSPFRPKFSLFEHDISSLGRESVWLRAALSSRLSLPAAASFAVRLLQHAENTAMPAARWRRSNGTIARWLRAASRSARFSMFPKRAATGSDTAS